MEQSSEAATIRADDAGLWLGGDLLIPTPTYLTYSVTSDRVRKRPTVTVRIRRVGANVAQIITARKRLAAECDAQVEIEAL